MTENQSVDLSTGYAEWFVMNDASVDYDEFEAMAVELEQLRLQRLYDVAAQRLAAIDRDPSGETVPFSEILGDEGYDAFLALDPDDLPDGELFA